jgi:hypothetical protein
MNSRACGSEKGTDFRQSSAEVADTILPTLMLIASVY